MSSSMSSSMSFCMSFSVTLMDLAGFAALLSWGIVRNLKLVNSHVVAAAAPNP